VKPDQGKIRHAGGIISLTLCCLSAAVYSTASPAAAVEAKIHTLDSVRARIESLRRDMSKTEKSKQNVSEQLRATETAIVETNRRLQQLAQERHAVEEKLTTLQAQIKRLEQQTLAQQGHLAQLLNRQFISGDADALSILLAGRDPNFIARDQYFLTQLSRAKVDLVQQLRTTVSERQNLTAEVLEQQTQLTEIARREQESRSQLQLRQQQREATLAQLAERLRGQKTEIARLRRDEQRLTNVIAALAAAARKEAAQVAAREAARESAKAAGTKKTATQPKVGAGNTASPPAERAVSPGKSPAARSYDPGQVNGAFSALRGRLRMPVSGQILARYGSARAEGGATWKGLFIRATEGEPIHAVAAGKIVFAEWLRGFGNLLIIDHGNDFLSVYANNEALRGAVGATVTAGQSIATAGNSGGYPDPGLYFELRHRGRAFDPLKWIGTR
jgi:septal ring factor EnvC (AmiA/AmiB activator)